MVARLYSGKKLKNKRLLKLFAHLGKSLAYAMSTGFAVNVRLDGKSQKIWLCPVGMKGDWPALIKVAGLVWEREPYKRFRRGGLPLVPEWPGGNALARPEHDKHEKASRRG